MSAHTNIDEAQALESEYAEALESYRADPTPERKATVNTLGEELYRARQHWRAIGEADGSRTFIKIEEGA